LSCTLEDFRKGFNVPAAALYPTGSTFEAEGNMRVARPAPYCPDLPIGDNRLYMPRSTPVCILEKTPWVSN